MVSEFPPFLLTQTADDFISNLTKGVYESPQRLGFLESPLSLNTGVTCCSSPSLHNELFQNVVETATI